MGAKIKIMPDITNLNQMANPNDRVMHTWVNEVSKGIKAFEQQIALINQKLATLQNLANPFFVTVNSGLNVTINSGSIKLTNGNVTNINSTNINIINNATSYIFIDDSGVIKNEINRPSLGYEIARIITNNGAVTQLVNYPLIVIRTPVPDFSKFATVDFVNSLQRIRHSCL